jgi:hypothetical protein
VPLLDMLVALPKDCVVGLEIPMGASAEAGVSAYDRLLPCVTRARSLLAEGGETRCIVTEFGGVSCRDLF